VEAARNHSEITMQIGFVGLGIMGRPMAQNLINGGHKLFVYGKRTVPPEIRDSATVLDSLKAVAEHAEVIIIMVPDTPDVRDVLNRHWPVAGQDRGRYEFDFADRNESLRR
jgi:2-hydroxy-3-oxopropionate reductase